jgi:hypothetical protein
MGANYLVKFPGSGMDKIKKGRPKKKGEIPNYKTLPQIFEDL